MSYTVGKLLTSAFQCTQTRHCVLTPGVPGLARISYPCSESIKQIHALLLTPVTCNLYSYAIKGHGTLMTRLSKAPHA